MDFFEVLDSIVKQWGAAFFIEDGRWWMVRYADYTAELVHIRTWDWEDWTLSHAVWDGLKVAEYNGDLMPLSGGALSYELSWKKLVGTVKLGKFLNKLLNGNFREFAGTDFEDWQEFFSPSVSRTGTGTADDPYRARISGVGGSADGAPRLYQIVPLGSGSDAASRRVRFSGLAYSNDVQQVVVICNLVITHNSILYVFGLSDDGKWVRNGSSGLFSANCVFQCSSSSLAKT
jgi:hypothetical protein